MAFERSHTELDLNIKLLENYVNKYGENKLNAKEFNTASENIIIVKNLSELVNGSINAGELKNTDDQVIKYLKEVVDIITSLDVKSATNKDADNANSFKDTNVENYILILLLFLYRYKQGVYDAAFTELQTNVLSSNADNMEIKEYIPKQGEGGCDALIIDTMINAVRHCGNSIADETKSLCIVHQNRQVMVKLPENSQLVTKNSINVYEYYSKDVSTALSFRVKELHLKIQNHIDRLLTLQTILKTTVNTNSVQRINQTSNQETYDTLNREIQSLKQSLLNCNLTLSSAVSPVYSS